MQLCGLRDSAAKQLAPLLNHVALDALGTASLFSIATAADEWVEELDASLVDDSVVVMEEELGPQDEEQTLAEIRAATARANEENIEEEQGLHKGGLWKYCIGLVGKPSAGKASYCRAY